MFSVSIKQQKTAQKPKTAIIQICHLGNMNNKNLAFLMDPEDVTLSASCSSCCVEICWQSIDSSDAHDNTLNHCRSPSIREVVAFRDKQIGARLACS